MKKQKISDALKWVAFGTAALAALLQTLAMLLSYDPNANYFLADSPLPLAAALFALVASVCGILCAALPPQVSTASPFRDSLLPSLPAALGMLSFPILSGSLTKGTIPLLASVALILAAIYTLLCGTSVRVKRAGALCVLGFTAILACALTNAIYYFDASLEMNAPIKLALQMALLFAMLYYTAELRYLLKREKPRLFIALSFLTLTFSSVASVSVTIAYCCGIIDRADCAAGGVLLLGIAITVLLRLINVLSADSADTPSEAEPSPQEELPLAESNETEENEE